MQQAWYIAADADELEPGVLLARTLFQRELVLFRDKEGIPHALDDRCAHRGARLSDGRHGGSCAVCPFHGWSYAGDGACTLIPANGRGAAIPAAARVRSYPVREEAGYLWVYLGRKRELRELSLPAELTAEDWTAVPFRARWRAHITRVVESVLDVSHLPFVHPHSTGEVDPRVDGPLFTATENEIVVEAKPFHPLVATPLNEEDHKGASTITFTWPNQLMLRSSMFAENKMATYLCLTPVGEEETILYGLALRNFLPELEAIDEIHYEHNVRVLDEDRPVVEGLRPKQAPLDLKAEVHVRSDAQQVRYRQMVGRKRLEEGDEDEG